MDLKKYETHYINSFLKIIIIQQDLFKINKKYAKLIQLFTSA